MSHMTGKNDKSGAPASSVMKRHARFVQVEYAKDKKGTAKRIIKYFIREKYLVIGLVTIILLGTLCGVLAPSYQSDAIDIIAGDKTGNLKSVIGLMLILYLCYTGCQLIQRIVCAHLAQRVVKQMRTELFGKVIDLPVPYLDGHSHGDVMSRMSNDVENISMTISQSLPSLCSGALTIAGTVLMMMKLCWQLALLSCGTIVLTVFTTKYLSKKVRKYSRKKQRLLGKLNGTVEEIVTSYRSVVAYNMQDATVEKFCENSDHLTKAGIRTSCFSGVMGPILNCIGNIGFVIIALFGGFFAVNGIISVGVISAFIVYARQFSRPVNEIAQIYGQVQTALAGAERVFVILDEQEEELSGEEWKEEEKAEVFFENVDFSYVEGQQVLKDFLLHVPSGKKVALVGATGSGKTTVVNLLMRFYDVEDGQIRINSQPIHQIGRRSLRSRMAIVLQDTVLFSDTIRNNLRYAKEDVTEEEIRKAVEMSRLKDLIEMLPDGYDTFLKGAGAGLSHGQRQLLAIARAFVADPEILIMDEATSSVDTRTEKAIQTAMQEIMKDRTSIVIAHRLSTIRDADMIIVLDEGRIVESGRHEELLLRKGKYHELYMTQYIGCEI